MKSLSLFIVIMLASCTRSVGQVIEKMNKKELRIELSTRRLEIDSMNNVIFYLHTQITKNNNSYDSLVSGINQTRIISDKNKVEKINMQKKIYTLKDSLAKYKSMTNNGDFIRELIINKYLRNKTFKLKYYNSHDGTGPNGGSFTSISEIDNKFYIGDISNGGKEIVKMQNGPSHLNSWKFIIRDNLEFSYIRYDKVNNGTINYKPIEWRDFIQSDSTYMSSAVINEDQLKIPIGFIELETIRGPFDFMIYYLIGKSTYFFNGKSYNVFNTIVLESNNVKILMTESN
tara:strand:+ start:799 stop:1659 length:861 start_codon:yes stop_codon:yes gene_type:complete